MIPELGHLALILALCLAVAQSVFGIAGAHWRRADWMGVARPAVAGQFVFVALAFGCLAASFLANDFSVNYVALNSNSALPAFYRVAAVWGAHEGSLLLWILVLATLVARRGGAEPLLARHVHRARAGRTRPHQRRLHDLHTRNVQSVYAPAATRYGWQRPQSVAAGFRAHDPSTDSLHRLRRFRGRVRIRGAPRCSKAASISAGRAGRGRGRSSRGCS